MHSTPAAASHDPGATPSPRPLAVAIVSKADRSGGGASLIAERLAEILLEAGHRVEHWVSYHNGSPKPFVREIYGAHGTRIRWCHQAMGRLGLQELVPWEYRGLKRHLKEFDVVHFHDISSAISPITVRRMGRWKPTVWTFHDCSPFTGGCLYPLGCEAFHGRCHACPQLGTWPLHGSLVPSRNIRLDFTGLAQDVKRWTAQRNLFQPVAPSHWMAQQAMLSGMFQNQPLVIPYPVNTDVFSPQPRAEVRQRLGLPQDQFLVLMAAHYIGDRRKGTAFAVEALNRCQRPIGAILVGHPDPGLTEKLKGKYVHVAGYITEPAKMADYFNAANAYIFPTLADNLPNSILESLACGTPPVAFRTGGVPEMVEHEVNGWLADTEDTAGLVRGLEVVFDRPDLRQAWSAAGQKTIRDRFMANHFLQAHVDLYRQVMARHPAAA